MTEPELLERLRSLYSNACGIADDAPKTSPWVNALRLAIDAVRDAFDEEDRSATEGSPEPEPMRFSEMTVKQVALLTEMQSLIADKAFIAAQGNADLLLYDKWQRDYYGMICEANGRIREILGELGMDNGHDAEE